MSVEVVDKIFSVLVLAEGLKRELRHSWLSDGRQESVAEHSYQMGLMAMLIAPYLKTKPDLQRTLEMILVHDLVEAVVGDVPFFETGSRKEQKYERECEAIGKIRTMLPEPMGDRVSALWFEFEEAVTVEAKFARALDNLEVQIQHNMASLDSWKEIEYELVYTKMDASCAHDAFLRQFCEAVRKAAEQKMLDNGVDVESVKARAKRG